MPLVTPLRPDDLRRVGRYRLSGRIADGLETPNSAGTFLSRLPDGSPVAITLLGRAAAPDPASRDRFSAEATVARRVAPFCAARILDAGFDSDLPFLVSEFIEGPSLAETVAAEGPLEGAVLAALAIGAATGLTSVHQAGLVHGDFGPDHVVLGADGPRVVHFSTTPPYGPATPSADLLAWAQTILFAAGRPDLASLPEPLRNTVAACLSPDPASRPPARTLVTALLGHNDPAAGLLAEGTRRARAAGRGLVATDSGVPAETLTTSRSRRVAWAAGCLACVGVIAAAGTLIATHRGGAGATASPVAVDHTTASAHTSSAAPTATPASPAIPSDLAGSWTGTVRQTQPALAVTVRIRLAAGKSAGSISYPQLGCSGSLMLVSVLAGTFTLDQSITQGQQSCESGVVLLSPQGSSGLSFKFRRSGAPSPAGVLAKTGP
jgi:eukaryotic-like serine/threonine-protein kinase